MGRLIELLKPCPFCGGEARLVTYTTGSVPHRCAAYCKCEKCGAETECRIDVSGDGEFLFKAIDIWNRRPEEPEE